MPKGIVIKPAGTILLILFIISKGYPQELHVPPARLMFYNVENLFDIYDDTLTADNEFLPNGLRRWNFTRYNRKINSLYKTLVAAGDWRPPDIIALCEIENRKVLEDLLSGTNLMKYDYGILHKDSPDERGIDVSLIYRKEIVKIIYSRFWIPSEPGKDVPSTRSILYAKCLIHEDTLHLFVNHWPSRRGGVLAAESLRMDISGLVRRKVDSIAGASPSGAKIIITGDFNCTPDDPAMKELTSRNPPGIRLVNLSDSLSRLGFGTYRYSGTWEMIDQTIVSDYLLKSKSGFSTACRNFMIFRPDFLLVSDPKFPGKRPFSTYLGYRYQGGFSDHLPVLLNLTFR